MDFRAAVLICLASFQMACASKNAARTSDNYLRYIAVEVPGNEHVLLHWRDHDMPLKVHLAPPASGLFEDPEALLDVVRAGVTDWTDVAGPGLPRFVFVENPGDADIPIVWETDPAGGWFIAMCVYDINLFQRRFGVAHILLSAMHDEKTPASLTDVYLTMLHEMGYALGLHAQRDDLMFRYMNPKNEGMTDRDRETLRRLYVKPSGSRVVGAKTAPRR